MSLPYARTPNGLTLHLRVTPKAGIDRIEGVEQRDDGSAALRVRVKAVPDKGKANAAVIVLLSEAFGLPKSSVRITAGQTARLKTVSIEGDAAALAERAAALGAGAGRGS